MEKIIKALMIIMSVSVILQITTAKPRPSPGIGGLEFNLSGCQIDSKLQETCQRCAKATKSNVVYPMCCSNEDEAYLWCQKYLGYGIH